MSIPKRFYKFLLKRVLRDVLSTELEMDQFDVRLREGTLDLKDLNLKLDGINMWISSTPLQVQVTKGTIRQLKAHFSLTEGCVLEVRGLELKTLAISKTKEQEKKKDEDTEEEEDFINEEDEDISLGIQSISSWLDDFISNILVRFVDTKITFENELEIHFRLLEYLNEVPTRESSSNRSVVKVVKFRGLEILARSDDDDDDPDRFYPIVRMKDPERQDEMNAIRVSIPADTNIPHVDIFLISIDVQLSPTRHRSMMSILRCVNNVSSSPQQNETSSCLDQSTRIESFVSCDSVDRTQRLHETTKRIIGRTALTMKFRILESRLRGYITDDTEDCLDLHAKHLELEFEMFQRGALRCNLDIENMYLNRVSRTTTSKILRFTPHKDDVVSQNVVNVEITRANCDSQYVLDVLLDQEMLIEFENQDTMTNLNEIFSLISSKKSETTIEEEEKSTRIDISVRTTQIKVFVRGVSYSLTQSTHSNHLHNHPLTIIPIECYEKRYSRSNTRARTQVLDCICFHVSNTMLLSPQRTSGPWILLSRHVHCFDMRSENPLIRIDSSKSDDAITVNILFGSNASAWLKSKYVDEKKQTYVCVSAAETKHFDTLTSQIEHCQNDDSIRTAIYVHVRNGRLSSSQQSFARIMSRLMMRSGNSDNESKADENQEQASNIGFCLRFDRLQARIRENRPYTKTLGVPYVTFKERQSI